MTDVWNWLRIVLIFGLGTEDVETLGSATRVLVVFVIHGSIHLGNKGFIEIPTRCILFIYLSALHVSGYAHLQELQMYFANHRCVY